MCLLRPEAEILLLSYWNTTRIHLTWNLRWGDFLGNWVFACIISEAGTATASLRPSQGKSLPFSQENGTFGLGEDPTLQLCMYVYTHTHTRTGFHIAQASFKFTM